MALSFNLRNTNKFLLKNVQYQCAAQYKVSRWNCINNYTPHVQMRGFSDCDPPAKCKVAIVTGGARGIGFNIAEHLLKAGAQAVIIGDVLMDAMEEATCKLNNKYGENKALFQPCDVTKKEDLEKIFKCTKERFGKIDIVVNNAGILADCRWEQTLCINIHGLVRSTLLGFQYMGAQNCANGGLIINTSSILGLQPLYSSPVYVGTKHFILGFTRSMGHEYFYKTSKVKVMAVCPGVTETNMIWEAADGGLPGFGDLGKELANSLGALPTQGPEEIGKAVIKMLKDGQNGSVWVSEGCDCYKVDIPDRNCYKPKDLKGCCPPKDESEKEEEDPCKKKEDPCKKKEDPCKKKEDPCKKKEDPCKKKDPCEKKEDPCEEKEDPCKKKEDPCKKKEDPCKKKDPCEKKEDPCEKKGEEPKKKEDHDKKKEDHKKKEEHKKKEHGKKKEEKGKKKEEHSKKKEEASKKKEDPCEKNDEKDEKSKSAIKKDDKNKKDSSKKDVKGGKSKPPKK
ncbi:unnamed protein product [Phaedon cochleariae]|uniref:15-hydroxyprostaglandin dehydrogenase [NAD(+)]-like n=1 Tax=Phaedon cochleariae TaxID=80249 RepID=A0A9P0DCA3_PHACE|nr:unnamed protein product [Phaedon cochleariae]